MGSFSSVCRKSEGVLVLFGFKHSGKSRYIKKFNIKEEIKYNPCIEAKSCIINFNRKLYEIWSVPGSNYENWKRYCVIGSGLIFLYNCSNNINYNEFIGFVKISLSCQHIKSAPVLIYLHNFGGFNAFESIRNSMLEEIRQIKVSFELQIIPCDLNDGTGIFDGFKWFVSRIR